MSSLTKMKTFFNTQTTYHNADEETITISDDDGSSVFVTEADWIEMGRMKGWKTPDTAEENVEEVSLGDEEEDFL